jgi:hypothetical protein
MKTLRNISDNVKYILIIAAAITLLLVPAKLAHAESELPTSGEGWSYSASGDLLIESDQGWAGFLKHGFRASVRTLYLGKDVTNCRMYDLPNDVPIPDYYTKDDVLGYDRDGKPYYKFRSFTGFFTHEIIIDERNPIFCVTDGLLINTANNEVVLSVSTLDDVIIPEGIKSIAYCAFCDHEIKSVQFPASLQRIGGHAFSQCKELTKIDLPQSLVRIEVGAFSNCESLREVLLPDGLEQIATYAFESCAIEYLKIPERVNEIKGCAFYDCDNLKQVVLAQGIKIIGSGAFLECDHLTDINFPDGLELIEDGAFSSCYELKRVILPDSLQRIGNKTFWGCDLNLLRIPPKLAFLWDSGDSRGYILNPHSKQNKSFELGSVDTVILSGSDYDFGYPAITNAKNVYFLGVPPEDVGQILDQESVEHIYCSDAYEFEWTRSKVASWVRQKLTILPAAEIAALTEEAVNATPEPTNSPRPRLTPEPTRTPVPVLTPFPTNAPAATPAPAALEEKAPFDPIILAFAGVLALVASGIVIIAVKGRKQKKRAGKI